MGLADKGGVGCEETSHAICPCLGFSVLGLHIVGSSQVQALSLSLVAAIACGVPNKHVAPT